MNVDAYLDRIGYKGSRAPTIETLRCLHYAHMRAVPFENLDIHTGRRIVLDREALFEKIVQHRRGGFCYELNGLFAALLEELGFNVTLLSARVVADGIIGPEFDHMALLVEPDERWLADVGFGESFREPLRLDDPDEQVQHGRAYRLVATEENWSLSEGTPGSDLKPQYVFTLQPRRLSEFWDMCLYHQTSPQSHFTHKRICSRATPSGRVTLSDMSLIVTEGNERREHLCSSDQEYTRALREHFGIDVFVERNAPQDS